MDDNGSRHTQRKARRKSPVRTTHLWKSIRAHKQTLLTGSLLSLIFILLIGIVSMLPGPAPQAAPAGETLIDYSAFVKQVRAGNVQAVLIRGQELDGLLKHPLPGITPQSHYPSSRSGATLSNTLQEEELAPETWLNTRQAGSANHLAGPERMVFVRIPVQMQPTLIEELNDQQVLYTAQPASQMPAWLAGLLRWLPMLLLSALFLFITVQRNRSPSHGMNDRVSQFGRSRARLSGTPRESHTDSASNQKVLSPRIHDGDLPISTTTTATHAVQAPKVTFDDIAGIDEVRAELIEIVQFLREPERFNRLGARIPCGALLVGPPGTGKTLLAKAVAGEAGVPFYSMSASEFVEMYVGIGASRVRDLFDQARKNAPCVIFIDEIDAVGRKRSMQASGNEERDNTLNQLLVELDGFDTRQAVVVLAATNRMDILDAALLRPGRFDRRITVTPPDRKGREAILQVHTREVPLHEAVDLGQIASQTAGMTGADLANLVNEAALIAARRDHEQVNNLCFEDALARVQLGAVRPLIMSEEERRTIAVHESGHALVAHYLPEADKVNRVTILPRGQSLGVTQFTAEVDHHNYNREELIARIAVALGGRIAEELVFGDERITTGAENDLQVVTALAHKMVTRWGMSERIGVMCVDNQAEKYMATAALDRMEPGTIPMAMLQNKQSLGRQAPTLSALIDREMQSVIREGATIARSILTIHSAQLTMLTQALIEHEQLDRTEFDALFSQ